MSGSRGEMTPEPAAGERVAVSLSEPLEVTAGTTYVAQVTVNAGGTGGYAAQAGGFATAVVNGDLTAPADGDSGGNGVFNDSSGVALAFASTDGSANYWVDVMFTPGDPPALPTGYPNASNTGASGSLPAYGGPLNITVDDTVIQNVTITGGLDIEASNVIVRNCVINYTDPYGVDGELAPDLTVEDCTITGPGVGGAVNAGILGQGTFTGNKISGSENGIVLTSGASTVSGNYIFDLRSSAGVPHYDGISCQGGQTSPTLIQHNTVISSDTSCIFLKDDFGAITGVTIDDNLCLADATLGAPGYMIVIDQVTSITSITVTDNLLTRGSFGYYSSDISATVSGNVNAYTGIPI
jgi:parallel beta-helix repeat protein